MKIKNVRLLIEESGLTQAKFAKKYHIKYSRLVSWLAPSHPDIQETELWMLNTIIYQEHLIAKLTGEQK